MSPASPSRDTPPLSGRSRSRFCALCAALILLAASAAQGRPAPAGATTPAAHAAAHTEDRTDTDTVTLPALALVIVLLVMGAIFWSYVWLIAVKLAQGRIFPEARLAVARWNEWDVIKVVVLFVLLIGAFTLAFAGLGGGGDAGSEGTSSEEAVEASAEAEEATEVGAPGQARGQRKAEELSRFLAAQGIANLLIVFVILTLIRSRGQSPAEVLGLRLADAGGHMISGLTVFFAFLPVLLVITHVWHRVLQRLAGDEADAPQQLVRHLIETPSPALATQIVIAAVLVAPVAEEFFFRGFVYGVMRRRVRAAIAIPAGGVLFALFHPPLAAAIPIGIFGAFLCYVYERTGRLTVPIAVHFLFNFSQVAIMMSFKSF